MFTIRHASCPKADSKEPTPEFEWAGVYMAGIADFECPRCGETILVEERENSIKVVDKTKKA
jgi:hypothetical protein